MGFGFDRLSLRGAQPTRGSACAGLSLRGGGFPEVACRCAWPTRRCATADLEASFGGPDQSGDDAPPG